MKRKNKEPKILDWYLGWKGRRDHSPHSGNQGQYVARVILFPIQARIAFYTGEASGDGEALDRLIAKLATGQAVACGTCSRKDIYKERHHPKCELVAKYKEVTTTKEVPPMDESYPRSLKPADLSKYPFGG